MADNITPIDTGQNLYQNTYNVTRLNPGPVTGNFATLNAKLQGELLKEQGMSEGENEILQDIQDVYTSSLQNKAEVKANGVLYDSTGVMTVYQPADGNAVTALNGMQNAAVLHLNQFETRMMHQVQQSFNVSVGTVVAALQQLGMTFADLYDKDNMAALTAKLKSGTPKSSNPTEFEMPVVNKLDEAVDILYDGLGQGGGTGDTGNQTPKQQEEEEFSQLIIVGDKTFLETVKIVDGTKTVTRTEVI
jgi:hypothetical protein